MTCTDAILSMLAAFWGFVLSIAPIISAICFIATVIYTYKNTTKNNHLNVSRAARDALNRMLFDIDKMLIERPELWQIYDARKIPAASGTPATKPDKAEVDKYVNNGDWSGLQTYLASTVDDTRAKAQREAFLYAHFNMFESAHNFYTHDIEYSKLPQDWDYKRAWTAYMTQFFSTSSEARALLRDNKTQAIYSPKVLDSLNAIHNSVKPTGEPDAERPVE